MTAAFEWNPEPTLLEKVRRLAQQRGLSPDVILSEAVNLYLETHLMEPILEDADPLIGLFSGSSDLATQSEDILQQEIAAQSGWTWK
jgi:hypothetical protein